MQPSQNAELHFIRQSLRAFARDVQRRVWAESLAYGAAAAAVVALLGAAALSREEPSGRVRSIFLVVLAATVAVSAFVAWRRARAFNQETGAAKFLESAHEPFRTDLRAALELSVRPVDSDVTLALRASLLSRVAGELRVMAPRLERFIPKRPLRLPATILAAALGAAMLSTALKLPLASGYERLIFGVAPAESASVLTPIVANVDVTVIPPAYTQLPVQQRKRTTGDFAAPAGSQIQLRTQLLTPASALSAEFRGASDPITLTGSAAGLSGDLNFQLTSAGAYQLFVTTPGGEVLRDPVLRRVAILADEAPRVELMTPKESREVMPNEVVNFEYVATDDYGLSAVHLIWYFTNDEAHPRSMALQGALAQNTVTEHVPFDLTPLLLQPGDEIVAFIEAWDNDQIAQPKSGRSKPVSFRLSSPQQKSEEVLRLKEELFEALLTQLGGTLAARLHRAVLAEGPEIRLEPEIGDDSDLTARVANFKQTIPPWLEILRGYEQIMKLIREDGSTPEGEIELLQGGYDAIYAAWLDSSRAIESSPATITQANFSYVATPAGRLTEATERTVLLLQDTIATQKARDIQDTMEELANIRERLSELLEQYRNSPDAATREQIEREIRRLEQRMRELLSKLAEQGDKLPYEHLNMEALEESEISENAREMTSSLDDVRQKLDSGDIEGAIAAMMELGQALDQLESEVTEPLDSATPDTLSEFDQEMAKLMDEVNNLETMQSELEKSTQALLDEMRQRRQAEIQEQLDQTLAKAREEIAQLRQEFERTSEAELSRESRQQLAEIDDSLERLETQLQQQDMVAAEETAGQLMTRLSDASMMLRQEEALASRNSPAGQQASQNRRVAEDGKQTIDGVMESLKRMMELGQPRPNAGESQQMAEMAGGQQAARERLNQLQQQMQAMGEKFPMIGDSMGEPMQQIGGGMDQSSQSLQGGKPRPALQGQQSALQGLSSLRQQMRQMTQRQRQQQQGQGRKPNEDRVEVPEDGQADRAAYRQRVVDAMRDGVLDDYQDEIQQYYESLLQ